MIHPSIRVRARSTTAALLVLAACAGGRGSLRVSGLRYPVSMTGSVIDDGGRVVEPTEAQKVGTLEVGWGQWTLLWTLLPLTGRQQDAGPELAAAIEKCGGNAAINVKVTVADDPLWILTSLIPVLPTHARVALRGDVVKL